MAPIFNTETGIFVKGNTSESWELFGINLLGAVIIILWSSFWSCLLFWCLNKFKVLRIEGYDEHFGLDLTQHGESAYPAAAWIEDQYKTENSSHAVPMRNIGEEEQNTSITFKESIQSKRIKSIITAKR